MSYALYCVVIIIKNCFSSVNNEFIIPHMEYCILFPYSLHAVVVVSAVTVVPKETDEYVEKMHKYSGTIAVWENVNFPPEDARYL